MEEGQFIITNEKLFLCVVEIAVLLSVGFKAFSQLKSLYLNHYALKNYKFDEAFVQLIKKNTVTNFGSIVSKPFEVFTYFKITAFAYEHHDKCAIILKSIMNKQEFIKSYQDNLDDSDDLFALLAPGKENIGPVDTSKNEEFLKLLTKPQAPPSLGTANVEPTQRPSKEIALSQIQNTQNENKNENKTQNESKKPEEQEFKREEFEYPQFEITQQEEIDSKHINNRYDTQIDPFELAKENTIVSNNDLQKFKSEERQYLYSLIDKESKQKLNKLISMKNSETTKLVARVAKGLPVSYDHLQDINNQIEKFSIEFIRKFSPKMRTKLESISDSESDSDSNSDSDSDFSDSDSSLSVSSIE